MSRHRKKMWSQKRALIHTLLTSAKSKQTTVADNNPGNPYIEIMQHPKTKTTIASSCAMLQ
jgi:hypothetical protein